MKARYKGDPANEGAGPGSISLFGLVFGRVDWTEIPADNAHALRKLPGNAHFEIMQGEAAPTVAPEPEPEPETDERTALRAQLDGLGISYDKRLGAEKLRALLPEAPANG